MLRPISLMTILCFFLALGGCSTTTRSGPTISDLVSSLSVAESVGIARTFAAHVERQLDAAAAVSENDKADLRAGAKILAVHAERVKTALDRFEQPDSGITLAGLQARADALDAERHTVSREWGVWQVRHGVRKPEEVYEMFGDPDLR